MEDAAMALYDRPRDPRFDPLNPKPVGARPGFWLAGMLPYIIGAVVLLLLITWFMPSSERAVNDTTNAGPQTQSVNPAPSPSTSPAVPTPTPTTESRPTQAPSR
jgi:hypothetical protein